MPRLAVRKEPDADVLYSLRMGSLWSFVRKQRPSFWLICIYLFFEYVRPQSIYPALEGLPWAFWAIIACAVAVVVEGKLFRTLTGGDAALLGFSMVVLLSSFFAYDPEASFATISVYLTWVLIFWLITSTVNTEKRFFVFMGLFLLFSLKMSQHASRSFAGNSFAFRAWGATGAPGWFRNSGEMAIQMTIFLPLSVYFMLSVRPWVGKLKFVLLGALPVTAVLALLASSSRGGQLAGAAVVLWMMLKSSRRLKALTAAAVLAVGVWVLLPAEQRTRFSEMGEDKDSIARLALWHDGIQIVNDNPVLGIGYDNWLPYYRDRYNVDGQVPHNIFLEAAAELGYTGLAAFLVLIAWTLVLNRRTRKTAGHLGAEGRFLYYMGHGLDAALVGYLASGFFVTVLYYPFFWINFAMTVALYQAAQKRVQEVVRAPGLPFRALPNRTRAIRTARVG